MPEINFQFMRDPVTGISKQEEFFFLTCRNQCFSGGYGNGKTYAGCMKAYMLLSTFPKYRMAILRASSTDLHRTTMATFFKICPPESYNISGNNVPSRNYLRLNNGSEVFWLHLDEYDESVVRGLEINSYLIDQAEEIDENIYLHLDSRIGRWDMAEVPKHLDPSRFPKNSATGRPIPPSYGMILCNPDAKTHWIYQRFHPDSAEHTRIRTRTDRYTGNSVEYSYSDTHTMIQASSYENPALSQETLTAMESRGEDFVRRFVKGEWGRPGGAIHEISEKSKLIDPPEAWLKKVLKEGKIYRALDHGDASPTCCLWFAELKPYIVVFQEYYKPSTIISQHRENIAILNIDERSETRNYYRTTDVCDPSMFNKTQQKKGGWCSLADEYATSEYSAPPIHFQPADNNEFITRSRISEALKPHPEVKHPLTGEMGAPKLYFVIKTANYPFGCHFVINETEAQKYEKLGVINGEEVYGDEREKNITDHSYDALRYGMARILQYLPTEQEKLIDIDKTFKGAREKAIRMQRKFKRLAGVDSHSYGRLY